MLYAVGNSGRPELAAAARSLIDDASPLVRGAAAWALSRLDPGGFAALASGRIALESDPDARAEWEPA